MQSFIGNSSVVFDIVNLTTKEDFTLGSNKIFIAGLFERQIKNKGYTAVGGKELVRYFIFQENVHFLSLVERHKSFKTFTDCYSTCIT